MNQQEALTLLIEKRSGEWNAYRSRNLEWHPDLSGLSFDYRYDFNPYKKSPFNLRYANLRGANMSNMSDTSFMRSDGSEANLHGAEYDILTKWPRDVDPSKFGAVFTTPNSDFL